MTSPIDTFTGLEDRQRVLTEILRAAVPRPGIALIALVDRATLAVRTVRGVAIPEVALVSHAGPWGPEFEGLRETLRGIALEIVPDADRRAGIASELITVVCRAGAASITPMESFFYFAWRYSNHLTAAFHGDVYAVTPNGWVALIGDWSGPTPALPITAGMDQLPAVRDAESVLATASVELLGVNPGECLLCYVARMLTQFGCSGQLRFARHYRDTRAPRATGLERRLAQLGARCDGAILEAYGLRAAAWLLPEEDGWDDLVEEDVWPDRFPPCQEVRRGSTQPCFLWQRHRRW